MALEAWQRGLSIELLYSSMSLRLPRCQIQVQGYRPTFYAVEAVEGGVPSMNTNDLSTEKLIP